VLGAQHGSTVVVVEHVSRQGSLEVIAISVLQGLAFLLVLFVLFRFGLCLDRGISLLFLSGSLGLVF